MKTYSQLATAISAYTNRTQSLFVVNNFDLLQLAVNNAKDYCQRALKFEYARAFATVPNVSLTDGASLLTAVRYNTQDPIRIRSIERAWLGFLDGSSQFPIQFITRDSYSRRLQRRFENLASADPSKNFLDATANRFPFTLVQVGQQIMVTPADTNAFGGANVVNVYLDIIEWLPDFTATVPITGTHTGDDGGLTLGGEDITIGGSEVVL